VKTQSHTAIPQQRPFIYFYLIIFVFGKQFFVQKTSVKSVKTAKIGGDSVGKGVGLVKVVKGCETLVRFPMR